MATSTKEASKTSAPTICEATPSVTSSPALESGLTLSDWLESETIAPCGPALVRVNLSARQAKEAGLLTSGTYGPHGSILFENAGLASFLESRLRAKMASHGSTLFALTCKERVTPAGAAIFALRASARRISDNDCSSWPTPKASDCQGGRTTETAGGGNSHLDRDVKMVGWATPTSQDAASSRNATATRSEGAQFNAGQTLTDQATLCGPARLTAIGILLTGSTAQTESGGQLSPSMSRWLMGLPPIWDQAAPVKKQTKKVK